MSGPPPPAPPPAGRGAAPEGGPPAMRARALGGLGWTGASEAVMQVVRMVTAVALARLLAPDDYGLAALALVFSSLVLVFSDLALGAAIVQRKVLTEDDRCTAFWLSVATGAVFTAVGVALAGPVASFYGEPAVAPLCAALAATFAITALATTHEALLLRDMRFKNLEQRMMLCTLAGAAAGIGVGIATRDAWAIIAQQITQSLVSSLLLWRLSPWRPRLRASLASLRALAGFSGWLVGHRLLYYAHRNADNILIGRFLGASALGAYALAYNIMLVPMSRIAGPVQRVLGPTFARLQDEPARIADAWVRVVRLLAMVSVPALLGLVVVAPDFVVVVLGDRWTPAIPLIQVLAWVGLLQSLQAVNTDILQARGRTRTIFRFTLVFSVAHVAAFAIGLQWGVVGVAVGYAISSTLVEPIYTVLTARSLGASPWRIVLGVRGIFEAALVMTGAVLAARLALLDLGAPAGVRLALAIPLGVAVFAAASAWRAPEAWVDVRTILAHVRRGRGAGAAAPALRAPGEAAA